MTVIYISDLDLQGSGYMNIAVSLCNELAARDQRVIALGLGYDGREHDYPFTIVPVQSMQDIVPMIHQLKQSQVDIEALVVALDIPLQERILLQLRRLNSHLPYVGIFPLEGDPLCMSWAMVLLEMDARLIMSEFGQMELAKAGVKSEHIPIAFDLDAWRPPHPEEREQLRHGLGVDEDTFVILTVADNQERKNLSRAMEIFTDFAQEHKALYWLVTRPDSPVGWKLEDYAMQLGIMDRVQIWKRGMAQRNLWSLYAAADLFLLTSKAEGLAMPVLESMACRLPVIGTNCAAIAEHLAGERGLLIEPDYVMVDPWGNSNRYLASREDGLYKLKLWHTGMTVQDNAAMLDRAQAYVRARNWAEAGDILMAAIKQAQDIKAPYVEVIREPTPQT